MTQLFELAGLEENSQENIWNISTLKTLVYGKR